MGKLNGQELNEAALDRVTGGDGSAKSGYYRCTRCNWEDPDPHPHEVFPLRCKKCGGFMVWARASGEA